MKTRLLYILFFLFSTGVAQAQDAPIKLHKLSWVKEKVDRGLQLKYLHTNRLFDSRQFINILKCNAKREISLGYELIKLKPTSEFAIESAALAAVNAGFFNMKKGGSVTFMKVDDEIIGENIDSSKRITTSCVVIDEKNRLSILASVDTAWLARPENYDDVLVTGPLLLNKGKLNIKADLPNDKRHPRTCVCTRRHGQVLLITVDGRHEKSEGMTLFELAKMTQALNCRDAINLDGGGSTTMWIATKGVVNHPSDNKGFDAQGERKVANVLLVH